MKLKGYTGLIVRPQLTMLSITLEFSENNSIYGGLIDILRNLKNTSSFTILGGKWKEILRHIQWNRKQ